MFGLMQDQPLMISGIIKHAARHHPRGEIVSKTVEGTIERTDYRALEARCRQLARALQRLGIGAADRVATLAWNSARHLELYYAISGSEAICHTVNPRLSADDIAYIVNDAADKLIFCDTTFVPIIAAIAPQVAKTVRGVVFMTARAHMPDIQLPPGMDVLCYEDLVTAEREDFDWPLFDERTAASLCYTSGTTGRPKGVLYSHRSTLLHAYAICLPDVFGIRAFDRVMPVVPMFHVNAWGIPYATPLVGASLVMPGRHLDGASVAAMMNEERVTTSAGVPTIWMGLLQYLRKSGERLATVKQLIIGGSACPRLLLEAFDAEYGVRIDHAWGMSETSPLGTYNSPTPATAGLTGAALLDHRESQGRAIFGIDIEILDDAGTPQPHDGQHSGNLVARGPWVASAYFGNAPGSALDPNGWFHTGDVATIDENGFMLITDRTKDVIKSGGEWISSIQLENIAVSHPDVVEAAIIAAVHPKWDERPLLLVVPKEGSTIDPSDLLRFYDGKVARWWLPDAVVVVDELPHTATGKISKLQLRDKYRNYLMETGADVTAASR